MQILKVTLEIEGEKRGDTRQREDLPGGERLFYTGWQAGRCTSFVFPPGPRSVLPGLWRGIMGLALGLARDRAALLLICTTLPPAPGLFLSPCPA